MRKIKLKNLGFILLLLIIVGNFIWHIYNYRQDIFKRFDSAYWTARYKESQWVVPKSKNSIGDDGLYMYTGYRYMQGDDPTLLNAEIPPLGKYIIGFFETSTGYMNAFSVFFGAVTLILFYLFNKTVFRSSLLALLPVAVLSFDPIFFFQIRAAYLDTLYLSFLLLGFLFFLRKRYILAGITFGAFMATKSPFLVVVVYAAVIVYMFLKKTFHIKSVLLMVVASTVVFILSYTVTFLHGNNLLYLLKVQKYIIHFYSTGAKGVFGAVFPMMLFDKWYTWYNTVQYIAEWTFLWPLAFVGGVASGFIVLKKRTSVALFQILWCIVYLLFLTVTPIFARYLLLLLPFLYNLSIWVFCVVIEPKSLLA